MASSTMFSRKTLKSFVKKRLCAAAEEIFGVVERIITEYEDQAFSSKQQIEKQQRILDVVLKPQIKLHRTDIPEKRQRIIKQTFEVENEDDDEDFPGFPALDDSLKHEEGSSLGLDEPQSPLQGQGETGWSTLRLLDVRSRGNALSADQEDASPPEIKEEPEELLIIPQIADTSSSTLTLPDRMSAVSTLPDTDSNATTSSPCWPIYVTSPVEPQPQMDVEDADDADVNDDEDVDDEDVDVDVEDVYHADDVDVDNVDLVDADGVDMSPVPGMYRVDRLAECLVGLRTQTGHSLNYKHTCAITELWLNLLPYDQVRVSFSPLACNNNRPGARWPDCGRLVASVLGKLCNIHTIQKKYNNHDGSGCYMLKWVPVLRDYNKIRHLLRRSSAVVEGRNLVLFDVDQQTFFDWHGKRTRMQRSSVHLQGLTAGVTSVMVNHRQVFIPQISHMSQASQVFPPQISQASQVFPPQISQASQVFPPQISPMSQAIQLFP